MQIPNINTFITFLWKKVGPGRVQALPYYKDISGDYDFLGKDLDHS